MLRRLPALALALLLALVPTIGATAQGSPYVPLDDPARPLFEHLVARGSVVDPSPFLRPFRRLDAVRVLREATGDHAAVRALLDRWDISDSVWEVVARLGGDGYTSGRRDFLLPAGDGGVRIYGDLRLGATISQLVLVTRPAIDLRASLDPDWTGARGNADLVCCRWRFPEAYLSWQPGVFRLTYGQVGRNWGPVGLPGTALSEVAYPRDEISLEVKTRDLHLLSTISQLSDTRSAQDEVIHRYHATTHLGVRISDRLHLAGWQAVVAQGPDRELEGPFRNPLILLPLANQYGMGDVGNNVMVGLQVSWRPGRTTLQGEVVLDDFIQHNRENYPDRYALTLAATGPAPAGTAYRLLYTRASSLAFRTSNPDENFTERGVGLGRPRGDNDQLTMALTRPVAASLTTGIDLTILRQGEGRLTDPVRAVLPLRGIFLGTVERTIRLAGRASGQVGPLSLQGELGVNRVTNPNHVAGTPRTRLEGRLTGLLTLGRTGRLR